VVGGGDAEKIQVLALHPDTAVLCAACGADIHEANLIDDPGTRAPPEGPAGSLEGADVGGAVVEVRRASAHKHTEVCEHAEVETRWPREKEDEDFYGKDVEPAGDGDFYKEPTWWVSSFPSLILRMRSRGLLETA
jgi:hypothetical protein